MNISLDSEESQPAMFNTNLVIKCAEFLNCSELRNTPGANIASPIVMFLTGTLGNAIAIFVLHRNSRREQMRTVFYVLVGSLAWTDLAGIILTTMPVLTVYLNGRWVGGPGLCNYHAFVMISIGVITPCIVCTMAVERFIGIRHGYFYKKHVNRSRIQLILLGQWIFVLIFASLPLFGFGQYARQYPGTWCFFNLHPESDLDSAYAYTFAILILVLILIIIVCNIFVIATLIGMRHRRKHLNSPSRERQVHRNPRQREIEIQMVILLVGITLLFTSCWAPLMIQILLNQLVGHGGDHRQDLVAIRLVSINQTFDPWVYILFRKVIFTKFWKYVRRLLLGQVDPPPSLPTCGDSKKLATTQRLLQQNGHCSSCRYHSRRRPQIPPRGLMRLEMPPTAIGCRDLIIPEKEATKALPEFVSISNSQNVDFQLTINESKSVKDGTSSALEDSALDSQEYDEDLPATINETLLVGAPDSSLVSNSAAACQLSLVIQNGSGTLPSHVGDHPLSTKSRSWTNYLDAFPNLTAFVKTLKTNSQSAQNVYPQVSKE